MESKEMPSLQETIQLKHQKRLRQEAIEHLAKSNKICARTFRQIYEATGLGTYQQFLNEQKRNRAWGTYIEATALAEKYGLNLVITPVTRGVESNPICLYRTDSSDAKTIHLYNSNNTHWYVKSGTIGDGNCLYNAIAQELFRLNIIKREQLGLSEKSLSTKSFANIKLDLSIFKHAHQEKVRDFQENIQSAISKAPTLEEKEQDYQQEMERISKLSPQEQKQIAEDHAYALRLAREEGIDISKYVDEPGVGIKP